MPPRRGGSRGRDKKGKKKNEAQALVEQLKKQQEELVQEEERIRVDVVCDEQLSRTQIKLHKKRALNTMLMAKEREMEELSAAMQSFKTSTSKQILKLDDELSRISMAKEVIAIEKEQMAAQLDKLRKDDGGKAIIQELSQKIKQMEAEKVAKSVEMDLLQSTMERKVSKQISENRLMRITLKETEQEYGRRIRALENSVISALDTMMTENEQEAPEDRFAMASVEKFDGALARAKHDYLASVQHAKQQVVGLTDTEDTLYDIKSMHSNLPDSVRQKLRGLTPEELLIIIDVLSFEDSVMSYLETKWPAPVEELIEPPAVGSSPSG
eukprot:NODE_2293_length_1094_cov_59.664943_g2275_i0.p1 GENE.NODE_2293_length_1094_cov_59.664943_g2275_i0~~NODE_2293_length_1094_cov_59.664943_g2275_i0.p1  ORF type:complete len:326 (+),score=93.35 NODE_2293_length_1094_cov_59.664943_g2275_i0:87-1064(+)